MNNFVTNKSFKFIKLLKRVTKSCPIIQRDVFVNVLNWLQITMQIWNEHPLSLRLTCVPHPGVCPFTPIIKSVFSESQTIALQGCVYRKRIFAKRFPWSPSWKTSTDILNARFVSTPTTNPKLYHVYTRFAVCVWRIMQEPATDKESFVVQSVKRKSICPKEIVSTVYRPVFSTTVCWVSLPFDGVAMEVA